MKKKSLAKQFGLLFFCFAMVTVLISSIMTYISKTMTYRKECVNNLQQLTKNLCSTIESDADEFSNLISFFKAHEDQVQVPADFRGYLPTAKKEFEDYLREVYPNRSFGIDLHYDDLSEEGQRLYTIYGFCRWFCTFFDAADDFGLSYVYFIFPVEDEERTMNYMFDPILETKMTEDGREILDLGLHVYEDPKIHKYMWEASDTGKAPDGFDSLNNEFGYVYTYCRPVILNGENSGLICAEISVDSVRKEILVFVLQQMLVSLIVLAIATYILFKLLQSRVLNRITGLEKNVVRYSEEKDSSLSEEILRSKGPEDELGSLATKFSSMITELDDYMINLAKVTAEKERIGAELSVATSIQADMLPRIFPRFPETKEFELFASMTPAKEVGGDFYDFFLVDSDHLAMVIADVSGKGVPAALFMVIAKTLIQNRLRMGESPSEALANVNNQLCEGNDSNLFVTVWIAVLDLVTGHALEANAGHEYPAIRRKNGSYEMIHAKHSPAVAIMEDMFFRETEFDMEPGDSLFVYTDGVTEATNANNELFGEERLLEALNAHVDASPQELLPAVRKHIDAFVDTAPQFDDLTMLGLRFHGKGSDPEEEEA